MANEEKFQAKVLSYMRVATLSLVLIVAMLVAVYIKLRLYQLPWPNMP